MEKLIADIDILMDHISSDTQRAKLPELSRKIIELSKIYGDAKREYIKAKNKYDNDLVMAKESWRSYLDQQEDKRYLAELETNPKAKKNKITAVECETQATLELIGTKNLIEVPQLTVVYLEPLLRSYQDWVNSIKFLAKETAGDTKFYSDQK